MRRTSSIISLKSFNKFISKAQPSYERAAFGVCSALSFDLQIETLNEAWLTIPVFFILCLHYNTYGLFESDAEAVNTYCCHYLV